MLSPSLEQKLAANHALIITHVYGTGPPQDLETYLVPRTASLTVISHPLFYTKNQSSIWKKYQAGKLTASGIKKRPPQPAVLNYIQDVLLTIRWAWQLNTHYDLAIAANGLNTASALALRFLKKANHVIFYCIDWVPQRFPNPVLNWIYHRLDRFSVCHANTVWNLSPRMAVARQQAGITKTAPQLTVPVGIWLKRFPPSDPHRPLHKTIVFMGHLRPGQGLPLLMTAFQRIHQRFPDSRLSIVGSGPLEVTLKEHAKALHLSSSAITFHGFVPDHQQLERILQQADVAAAPYEPDSFTYYTDPGKPKVYLACSLPIIITDIPTSAQAIAHYRAGLVIPYTVDALVDALLTLFNHPAQHRQMQQQARRLAETFDWETLFPHALAESLSEKLY